MKFDGKAFGEEIVALTKSFVERSLAPMVARLQEVEKQLADARAELAARPDVDAAVERALAAQEKPAAVDFDAIMRDLDVRMGERIAALPKAPTAEEVAALVPAPKDGRDGADGVPGADGRDGVDGLPGKDGKDGRDGVDGEKGVDGARGRDGIGMAGVLKDHEGCLVFTLSDGTICKVARVDGADGKDGAAGKDGAPGRDVDMDIVRASIHDEVQKQVMAPLAAAYKGVWRPGAFKAGDVVTWAGSLFIAAADTEAKPETHEDWKLAVKRGRDGKDGEAPKPPPVVKLK